MVKEYVVDGKARKRVKQGADSCGIGGAGKTAYKAVGGQCRATEFKYKQRPHKVRNKIAWEQKRKQEEGTAKGVKTV